MADFGKLAKELRKKYGYRAEDIAAKCGVNRATIYRWEQGDAKIPALAVEKLANLYGFNPNLFFQYESEDGADFRKKFCAMLEQRKAQGIDQQDVADALGVSKQTVTSWKNGSRTPRGPMARLIEEYSRMPAESLAPSIASRIRRARKAKGITTEELGKAIGVERSAVTKYEKGRVTNIPHDRIEAIAAALDVTPGYLTGWADSQPAPVPDERISEIRKEVSLLRAHLGKLEAMLDALSD